MHTRTYDLAGKVALITGAAHGIGRAITERLAREGCHVALFDRDSGAITNLAEKIQSYGVRTIALTGDVALFSDLEAVVQRTISALERIDILVNNAGIVRVGRLVDLSEADWKDTIRVNLDGVFHGCKAVVPHMIAKRGGSIINMSSWIGKSGAPLYAAYGASKAGIIGLTRALALELAPERIRVNAICPGFVIGTEMRSQVEQVQERFGLTPTADRESSIPWGRASQPDDVARVTAFLASEQSDYLTGEAISVTGGLWVG